MLDALGPRHPGAILGYCTNVHAGATLRQTLQNLRDYAAPVKAAVSPGAPMGVGLWLSAEAARELAASQRIAGLRAELGHLGLRAYTVNGFPYGNFHEPVVKHRVYEPDWSDPARLAYTLDLARVLAGLLPDDEPGQAGSISTLPLGWGAAMASPLKRRAAAANLLELVHQLARLELDTGRYIQVDLEPEPGCALQTSRDVTGFFAEHLLPGPDEESVRAYLGVCHDVCHAAVMGEDQVEAIGRYRAAGVRVGKVQISSAVQADFASAPPGRRGAMLGQLREFAEPRYLHQTVVGGAVEGGGGVFYEDLPEALERAEGAEPDQPWRVHFHVPVFMERIGELGTTRGAIAECLGALEPGDGVVHFEVETYAWNVLPGDEPGQDHLVAGIAQELGWVRREAAGVADAARGEAGH